MVGGFRLRSLSTSAFLMCWLFQVIFTGWLFNFESTLLLLWRAVQDCVFVIQDLTSRRSLIIFAVLVYFVSVIVLRVFLSAR